MFTGIIENIGTVKNILGSGTNKTYVITSSLAPELKVDQSIAHDGVCLTVEAVDTESFTVTAIAETLSKTALNHWVSGSKVNLERSLLVGGRLDGHFVQGHVDTIGICKKVENRDGSYEYAFSFPETFANLIIEKGSICVNGVSLTAFNVSHNSFSVALIPYTYQHTNLQYVKEGTSVNLEFDMMGKYIVRMEQGADAPSAILR
jgi:riboflavin synthase